MAAEMNPETTKRAVILNQVMSQVVNLTSPRHVIRWLAMYSGQRAQTLTEEVAAASSNEKYSEADRIAFIAAKGYAKRIKFHTTVKTLLDAVVKELDAEEGK
jgi:hypothetical protein